MRMDLGFRAYLGSLALAQLATSFHIVVLQTLVFSLTQSGRIFSLILMASVLPRPLLALVGGHLSDRLQPAMVIAGANLAKAILLLALAAWFWIGPLDLWGITVLAICIGVADAFFYPATLTVVPALVKPDARSRANALAQGTNQTMALLGPSAAGFLISFVGVLVTLTLQTACLLLSILPLTVVSRAMRHDRAKGPTERSGRLGLGAMREKGLIAPIAIILSVNLLFLGPHNVGTALLSQRFDHPAFVFGTLLASFGAGALAGTALGALLTMRPAYERLTRLVPLVFASGLVCLFFADTLLAMAIVRFVLAAIAALANVVLLTSIQNRSPDAWRGRVMGWVALAAVTALPLSYLLAAFLTVDTRPNIVFIAAAVPLSVIGLFFATGARTSWIPR